MKQRGFFEESDRLKRLSQLGDPLEKASKTVSWEVFRPLLNRVFPRKKGEAGGRPPWDNLLMFKILLLQSWYGIADDKTEYMINDRLSFQRFLGLGLGDKVPDAKTIWLYKDVLSRSGSAKELFDCFAAQLESQGVITREGSLIDASFVDVPRQRNTRQENEEVKEGKIPEEWEKPENAAKLRQKDVDARWTKKGDETHYGYKDHVKVDQASKLIMDCSVTNAAVHDSREMVGLIDEKDEIVYADSAYVGKKLHEEVFHKYPAVRLRINEKGYRNSPLTEGQKATNREKSKVRARVEHVFGHMSHSMGGLFIRCIGIKRATCAIVLKNLAYNVSRFVYLACAQKEPVLADGISLPIFRL